MYVLDGYVSKNGCLALVHIKVLINWTEGINLYTIILHISAVAVDCNNGWSPYVKE